MIYTYDGSFDGLLCCIYAHYYEGPAMAIYEKDKFQPQLFEEVIFIEVEEAKAKKVYDAIHKKLSSETYWDIYRTFLSNEEMKDIYVLRYLITAFKMGSKIDLLHAHKDTLPVRRISRQVGFEKHRFLGLLRFEEVEEVLYAKFEPDHNVLVLLGEHFSDRLANERFVIHDVKRGQAIISNFGKWGIVPFDLPEYEVSETEKMFQELWKGYFKSIAIEARKNLNLQQNYVPLKYRKHILEFQDKVKEA